MRGTVFFFDVTDAGFPRENVIIVRYDRPRS